MQNRSNSCYKEADRSGASTPASGPDQPVSEGRDMATPIICEIDAARKLAAKLIEARSIPEPTTGCWLWERSTDGRGYGQISWPPGARKMPKAHRVSHFAATGEWPLVVRHTCDQKTCVNPGHLIGGTHADNAADRTARGRGAVGVTHGSAKLTEEHVRKIRDLFGHVSQRDIAKQFGVGLTTISDIFTKTTWRHLL